MSLRSSRRPEVRALLVGAAPDCAATLKRFLREGAYDPKRDTLVAIDGGLKVCQRLKLKPKLVIGDWDSFGGFPPFVSALTLPQEKDRSDLYYALQTLKGSNVDQVLAFGVTGGRPDHHLAALYELAEFSETGIPIQALDLTETYDFLSSKRKSLTLRVPLKTRVSIFSLGPSAQGVSLSGFRYALKGSELGGHSLGLSNEVLRKQAKITLTRGRVVVMVERREKR